MYIGLIVCLSLIIAFWVIIKNGLQKRNMVEHSGEFITVSDIETKISEREEVDVEEMFLNEVKRGEKTCKLMCVFDQIDLLFIKSLFQSESIPYYIESEHVSQIKPGVQIGCFGNQDFYILQKDYDDALSIIEKYRKNKDAYKDSKNDG